MPKQHLNLAENILRIFVGSAFSSREELKILELGPLPLLRIPLLLSAWSPTGQTGWDYSWGPLCLKQVSETVDAKIEQDTSGGSRQSFRAKPLLYPPVKGSGCPRFPLV